jgi:hypothetical protein
VSGTGDNANVEGVDIVDPVFNFSVTKTFAAESKPSLVTLYSLTGKLNDAEFAVADTVAGWGMTFPDARTCMFLGASFGESHKDPSGATAVDVTYSFSAAETVTKSIGSIGDVTKGAFDYLWVRTMPKEVGNVLPDSPVSAYVHKVYESGDFTGLGL